MVFICINILQAISHNEKRIKMEIKILSKKEKIVVR